MIDGYIQTPEEVSVRRIDSEFDQISLNEVYSPLIRQKLRDKLLAGTCTVGEIIEWGQYGEFGYYTTSTPMGDYSSPHVDFVTRPEADPAMGYSIGQGIWSRKIQAHNPDKPFKILILGDGTGRLTGDCLSGLTSVDSSLLSKIKITMVDATEHLLQKQRERLAGFAKRGVGIESIHASALDIDTYQNFYDLIQHNELLDALPVKVLRKAKNGIEELFIRLNTDEDLVFYWDPSSQTRANNWYIEKFDTLITHVPSFHQPDVAFLLEQQVQLLTPAGSMLFFDYFSKKPTHYKKILNLGWGLSHKLGDETALVNEKFNRPGLAATIQALGLVDTTLRVNLVPIQETLQQYGDIKVKNQARFQSDLVAKFGEKFHFLRQLDYLNFQAIVFERNQET